MNLHRAVMEMPTYIFQNISYNNSAPIWPLRRKTEHRENKIKARIEACP